MSEASIPPTPLLSLAERHRHHSRLLITFVLVSLFVHLGALGTWALWPKADKSAINLDDKIIKTKLVRLGKPRDEDLLPRLPTSAPPPPAAEMAAPKLEQPADQKPEPAAKDKPSASDILEKFKQQQEKRDIHDVIKDRLGAPTEDGQLEGDKDGSELEGEINQSYYARVTSKIQTAMEVSSVLTDDERVRLKATLCFTIDEDGAISDLNISSSSGSSVYDGDVLAGARRASPVPAPPPTARERAKAGVCLNFCPTTCR